MKPVTTSLDGPERPLDPLDPAEWAQLYAHKPLPPLPHLYPPPRSVKRKRLGMNARPAVTATAAPPCVVTERIQASAQTSPRTPSFASGHRSSLKVQQLTGLQVNVADGDALSFGEAIGASEDSSSSGSREHKHETGRADRPSGYSGVPSLEADRDGQSSRLSPAPPRSPQPLGVAALRVGKAEMRRSDESTRYDELRPYSQVVADEDLPQRWDGACVRFSDSRAAARYHRWAVELASPPEQRPFVYPSLPATTADELSASGPNLARTSRRPPPIDARTASLRSRDHQIKTPYLREARRLPLKLQIGLEGGAGAGSPQNPARDDMAGRASFRRSAEERNAPTRDMAAATRFVSGRPVNALGAGRGKGIWGRTGEAMREMLSGARERMRTMQMSKDERRREELRKRIRVLTHAGQHGGHV